MRWTKKRKRSDWYRWFAILPVSIGDETVWLQWYWWKPYGEYDLRSAVDPDGGEAVHSQPSDQAPSEPSSSTDKTNAG